MVHRPVVARLVMFGLALAALVASADAQAQGLRIKVRGAAKITARASRDQGELVLSGSLTDDAGEPLGGQSVTVRVTREADPHDPKVAEGLRAARGCDRSADRPRPQMAWAVSVRGSPDAPEIALLTDEDGRFCFRARLDPDRYGASLHWRDTRGGTLLDPADQDLAFDLSRRSLALSFDPRPKIVPLDAQQLGFEALAIVDDDATPRVATGLSLVLSTETGKEIARTSTDASGRARFLLASQKVGPPGPGELRVSFAGDADTAKAEHVEAIERHAKVSVRVPAADRGELVPRVPEDGIAIDAEVTSVAGPVSEGAIEAHVGDVVVGAAPVERGLARLTLTFAAQGTEAHVALRYVPSSPWYEPLPEPTIRIPIRGPGILSKAPILLAGLAVLVFFLVGRVSSKSAKTKAAPPRRPDGEARDGRPKLEVVRAAARGERGWTGRVIDAHEGTPVANARVWIERGTFEGRSVLASTTTNARGELTLPPLPNLVGDEQIVAEGPLHARLVQPLPGPGEIAIALAERRRALLARLVGWAKRRGAPFDVRPEPTPGHVRRAAGEDRETAQWADAVERAVFGGEAVDARIEREIEALAPGKDPAATEDAPPDDRG
jgi:hypothetical protein